MKLIAILIAAMTAGCSFALVNGPPSPDCTTQSAAPTVDGAAGAILGLVVFGIGIAASSFQGYDCDNDCAENPVTGGEILASAAVGALVAAPFIISATVGERRIGECRQVKAAELEEPLRGNSGHLCRRDGSCNGEAVCRAGSCVVAADATRPLMPVAGEACRRDPEVPVGLCAAGLACVSGRCAAP